MLSLSVRGFLRLEDVTAKVRRGGKASLFYTKAMLKLPNVVATFGGERIFKFAIN